MLQHGKRTYVHYYPRLNDIYIYRASAFNKLNYTKNTQMHMHKMIVWYRNDRIKLCVRAKSIAIQHYKLSKEDIYIKPTNTSLKFNFVTLFTEYSIKHKNFGITLVYINIHIYI